MGIVVDSFDRADTTAAAGLGVTDTGQAWQRFGGIGMRIVGGKAGSDRLGTQTELVDTGAAVGVIEARMSGLVGAAQGAIKLVAMRGGFNDWLHLRTFSFADYVEAWLSTAVGGGVLLWSGSVAGSTNGSKLMGLRLSGSQGAWLVEVLADGAVVAAVPRTETLVLSNLWGIESEANSLGRFDDLRIATSGGRAPLRGLRARQRKAMLRPRQTRQLGPHRGRQREL